MRRKLRLTLTICIFLASTQIGEALQATVGLDHQVYPLLKKAESLQLFQTYELRLLPLSRDTVLNLLLKMEKQSDDLSRADKELLFQMLGEFQDPAIGEASSQDNEIHAMRYEENAAQLFVDLRALNTFDYGGPDVGILRTSAMGAVRGKFGDRFFFGLTARNTMILGEENDEENFDVAVGDVRSRVGAAAFSDQATGYMTTILGRFRLTVGRDFLSWGGPEEQLSLSDLNEPMDLIRVTADFSRFRVSYVHANLQGIDQKRYLAGHRIDFLVSQAFQVGIYETVVYGGRGPEFGYLNPLVPYHIMEHQLGDLDNNTFGFDFNFFPKKSLRVYGECFVDDLSFDKPLGSYWGNKLAYLGAVHWAQPFLLKWAEFSAGYVRVDPFVYSHADSINRYSHYGESLGSRVGPNGDLFFFGLILQGSRDLRLRIGYNYERKGEGQISQPHQEEDGERKGFLDGNLEKSNDFSLGLKYQFRRDQFIGFEIIYQNRRNVNRIKGNDYEDTVATIFLDMNY